MTDRSQPATLEFIDRLAAQVDRARTHFASTIDPGASLAARGEATEFLTHRQEAIRAQVAGAAAGAGSSPLVDDDLPIFTYWDTGPDHAPPLVQACLTQLRRVYPGCHVLTRDTVSGYVTIPGIVADRLADRPAQFSDFVRVSLLERYGGVWVDATCFVPAADLTERVEPLLDAGVIYQRWGGKQIANWFIGARPANTLIALQRAALEAWWTERDDLPDYFLFHRIFEAITTVFPEARRLWRQVPHVSAIPSHILQLAMFRPFDPVEARAILEASFVHKLSYKYDPGDVPADSLLARVLDGTLANAGVIPAPHETRHRLDR